MKKYIFILFSFIIISLQIAIAQNNVTMLHHAGVVTSYTGTNGFINAYTAASNGDTIYLGGGIFTSPGTFVKGLVVFGAGIDLDSSIVTNNTTISGEISLGEGADNSQFYGLISSVSFNSLDIDNITFDYCKIINLTYYGTYTAGITCDNHQYIRCYLTNTSNFNTVNYILIQNCLISQQIRNIHENGVIDHCIITFAPSPSRPLDFVSNSVISNCKFANSYYFYSSYITNGTNNLFSNNAFNLNYTDAANTYVGNYYGVVDNTFFIGDPDADGKYDYHLQTPASYIGTDGEQICLYGGDFAWKEGSMPGNPHIFFKNIGATSNEDGTLDVEINVNAQ